MATHVQPVDDPAANVLNVKFPLHTDVTFETYTPTLSSFDEPPSQTQPILAKAMLVPFTAITDAVKDVHWQVENSPFYIVEREVYYVREFFLHNDTEIEQENSVSWTKGIEKSKSETFSSETSISISYSSGISLGPLSSKITATLTQTFGYSTSTSVTAFEEKTVSAGLTVPPRHAAVLWHKRSLFTVKRHDGTKLQAVGGAAEVNADVFIASQYPPAN